jgi:RNA polymerase sigma factor (sigma-70 family)
MTSTPLVGVLRYIGLLAGNEGAGDQSDQELLQRFVAGRDESAFAALLERHGPLVLGVCRRVLGDAQDVEDAFQAAFLVLARKAASIRKQESLAAWLHRVTVNLCRTAQAGTARRQAHERHAAQRRQAAEVEVALSDWQPVLHQEVDRLPDKYRLPVILCYFEEKSHSEAAVQLGWPLGTVKGRLARARDLLRSRLARRGVSLTAAGIASVLAQQASAGAVPPALLDLTLHGAVSFAGCGAVASADALALAKGVLQAMTGTRPAHLLVLMLIVGVLTFALSAGTTPETQQGDPVSPPPGQMPMQPEVAARLDRSGDPLPPGAIARLGTTRFRHGKAFEAIAFSPDGKTIASAGVGGSLVLHDVATGKKLHSCRGEEAVSLYHPPVAFAPDGKTLASAVGKGLDSVCVWEVATGKRVAQFRSAGKPVYYLAFSKEGRTLAGAEEHIVHVWDVQAGKTIGTIAAPDGTYFHGVVLAPDGKTLITGVVDKKEIVSFYQWETASSRKLHQWQAYPDREGIHALALSPDGKQLACALGYGDGIRDPFRLRVWGVPTGELQIDIPGEFHTLRFSPTGQVLAAGASGSVSLVAMDTGKEIRRIPTGWIPGVQMDFRPDGKVLALGALWSLTLWDVARGERVGPLLEGHERVVEGVMFLPDSKTLATQSEGAVHFWQPRTGKRVGRFVGTEANFNHQALSPDGKIRAAAGWHRQASISIGLWDTATGKKRCDVEAPPSSWPREMVFSPDGKTLGAASHDSTLRLWNTATGKSLLQVETTLPHLANLAFATDDKTLAVGDADVRDHASVPRVRLLDALTGQELRKPFELPGTVGARPGTWSSERVGRVAFSADGKRLAAATSSGSAPGTDHAIQVWEVETGQVLCRLEKVPVRGGEDHCRFALSPDGKSLLTPGEIPQLWEVATGKVRGHLRGHAAWVGAVAFSPDGKLLASGSRDTTALVWDALNPAGEPRAAAKLSLQELESLWADLQSDDAVKAYRAIRALVAADAQAVPFLAQRLRQISVPDPKHLARLIADLDAREFTMREKVTRELKSLGRLGRPALKQALAGQLSLEVRRRVEALVQELELSVLSPAELQGCRAVEALERTGPAEAREVLEQLARSESVPFLARDAREALERLKR